MAGATKAQLSSLAQIAAQIKQIFSVARRTPSSEKLDTLLEDGIHLTATLETRLEQAGAERPAGAPRPLEIAPQLLDTPANRRYREALQVAWEAGLAVDRERYGSEIGTDGCAQVIEMVLCDVQSEIQQGQAVALLASH